MGGDLESASKNIAYKTNFYKNTYMTRPFHKNLFFYLGERFSGRGNGDMKKRKKNTSRGGTGNNDNNNIFQFSKKSSF